MRSNLKNFHGVGLLTLSHSAKGSTWEEHKYIKRIDGTYYYPDDYKGGRHLSDKDVDNLSDEVIRGNFGNDQTRKDLLGENYQQIQDQVNKKLLGSMKLSDVSKSEVKDAEDLIKKIISKKSIVERKMKREGIV